MGFHVVIQQTSQSFEVDDNESVLDAALRRDVQLAHECTFGLCRECRRAALDAPLMSPQQASGRVAPRSGTVDLNQRVWMTSRKHGEGRRTCELML